mgnify:CR=1 FL=1
MECSTSMFYCCFCFLYSYIFYIYTYSWNIEKRLYNLFDSFLSFDFSKTIDYELNKKSYLNTDYKVKVEGEILSTCPMKGCWMKLSVAQDTILVRFKDYGFFVPKTGVKGSIAIVNGYLSIDTLSVAQLRHYAEDSGKNKNEENEALKKIMDEIGDKDLVRRNTKNQKGGKYNTLYECMLNKNSQNLK